MLKHRLFICFLLCQLSLASITVTGVNKQISGNISHRLEYKMRHNLEKLNEQTLDQIYSETAEAIKPYGYFNPTITISDNPQDPKNIIIDISLGVLTRINDISITYINPTQDNQLKSHIQQVAKSYEFSPFTLDTLYDLTTEIKLAALDAGYSDVLVNRGETSVNRYTNSAKVQILITPKDINRYGNIILPEDAKASCFTRFHNIKEGDKYNAEKIARFQKNMMQSGQFKQTNVRSEPRKLTPNIQDIIVEYERKNPYRYFLGFGFASNLSDNKLVPEVKGNITRNNLGGCGIELGNMFRFSKDTFIYESQLLIPSELNLDSFNALSFQFNSNNIKSEDSSNFWSLQWLFQYTSQPWVHRFSTNLLFEESTLNNNTPYTTTLVYPKYSLSGKYQQAGLSVQSSIKALGGLKSIGSDIDFFKLMGNSELKINSRLSVIKNQVTIGKIWTDSFSLFPLSMQFFLGGADSHRGLDHHEINEGKEFFLSKNSAQLKLPHHFQIGAFYDTGYCTNSEDYTLQPAFGTIISYAPSFGIFELSVGKLKDGSSWVILVNVEPGEDLE
ncbi:MAG: POTRA domain-containing protein [Pseudomonadota bacterium]|nr:POTRA domain-containing protein [Pseudomonadota bacterium]